MVHASFALLIDEPGLLVTGILFRGAPRRSSSLPSVALYASSEMNHRLSAARVFSLAD